MIAICRTAARLGCTAASLVFFLLLTTPNSAGAETEAGPEFSGPSHYLRGAYQIGTVLETNDFLGGDNKAGTPIDTFNSVRLEYGWQTDGSQDWHHLYNFPSYGIGLYGADYFNDRELGQPTSLYGFYVWPFSRRGPWTFSLDLSFGLTTNWKAYDPVHNPQNTAIGLGRSVHIEVGPTAAYRLSRRWSLIGSLTFTHFSNGGTQKPNNGLNQVGPMLFVKHDLELPVRTPARRHITEYPAGWDLTMTGSAGRRNLNLRFDDPALRDTYLNRNYFIGNFTVGVGRRFSTISRYVFGLDLGYDESVGDLIELDGFNDGRNAHGKTSDNFELAAFAGYEIIVNHTHLQLHLGYKLLYKDLDNRLPVFYQRLGVKHYFLDDWFAGLNVRFHEIGSADNLEWTVGHRFRL